MRERDCVWMPVNPVFRFVLMKKLKWDFQSGETMQSKSKWTSLRNEEVEKVGDA